MRENIRCQPSEETSGYSAPVQTHSGDVLMVNEPLCEWTYQLEKNNPDTNLHVCQRVCYYDGVANPLSSMLLAAAVYPLICEILLLYELESNGKRKVQIQTSRRPCE